MFGETPDTAGETPAPPRTATVSPAKVLNASPTYNHAPTPSTPSACLDFGHGVTNTSPLMAEQPKANDVMERIVSLCKRRGFVFQSSEIYGGINGFWDYGPLGAELKRNLKEAWWKSMTQRDDVVGLDATIIMHPKIWQASGHTTTFADPMVDCLLTKKRFRADQIDPQSGVAYHYAGAEAKASGFRVDRPFSLLLRKGEHPDRARKIARQFYAQGCADQAAIDSLELLEEKTEKVENSTRYNPENGSLLTEARLFNLMFKTYVGPVESEDSVAFLRPETAQAIFVQFKNVAEVSRARRFPSASARWARRFATRSTRGISRFARGSSSKWSWSFSSGRTRRWRRFTARWRSRPGRGIRASRSPIGAGRCGTNTGWRSASLFYESIGLPRASLVEYWQKPDELAHYARADRGYLIQNFLSASGTRRANCSVKSWKAWPRAAIFDLSQHQRFSGKPMGVFDDELKAAWPKLDPARQMALGEQYYAARKKYLTKNGRGAGEGRGDGAGDAATLGRPTPPRWARGIMCRT